MTLRIAVSHLIFLAIVTTATLYISTSAVFASSTLYNLVVVAPVAVVLLFLVGLVIFQEMRKPLLNQEAPSRTSTIGDIILLACFSVFCIALTKIGFDVATFLFVWLGVVLGGERNWWLPPIFAAVFTVVLVKGFGSLFPFPMLTLVL